MRRTVELSHTVGARLVVLPTVLNSTEHSGSSVAEFIS